MLALLTLVAGVATHPTFLFPLAGIALGLTVVAPDGVMGWRWPTRTAWSTLWVPFLAALALGWIALKVTGGQAALEKVEPRGVTTTLNLVPAIVQWLDPVLVVTALLGAVFLLVAPRASGDRRWAALALGGGSSTLLLLLAASLRTAVYADYATGIYVFGCTGGVYKDLYMTGIRNDGIVLKNNSYNSLIQNVTVGTGLGYLTWFPTTRWTELLTIGLMWATLVATLMSGVTYVLSARKFLGSERI